jgi:hypothetical protein
MYLRQTATHLVSCLFKTGIYITRRGSIKFRKMHVESRLFSKEMISPNVSFENRVEGCGIVANNLHMR